MTGENNLRNTYDRANAVCVTYNSASTIEEMLLGLNRQGSSVASLVVMDNGSTDDTIERVKAVAPSVAFAVHTVSGSNVGFGRGINAAAKDERLDQSLPLLVINPDLRLSDEVLPTMLAELERNAKAGIVTAPLVREDGLPDTASARRLPTFGASVVYSVLGKRTPKLLRYNSKTADPDVNNADPAQARIIEATTGALMLISPKFRSPSSGVFDEDYWMYGEDLQLCRDAIREGFATVMTAAQSSLHYKGVSSGWPRSWRSNKAFHDALFIYYKKNLSISPALDPLVWAAVQLRLLLSAGLGMMKSRLSAS